jgi:uncharacterized protein (TIGR02271 family)
MPDPTSATVTTANGLTGTLDLDGLARAGSSELVNVQLETGQQLWVAPSSLVRQADGHYLLPVAVPQARRAENQLPDETTIIPVVAEEAVVSTRPVETGGVRVSKVVHERQETAQMNLLREDIEVRREPSEEWVTDTEPMRQEGDTWVLPIYEEVLVVEKRLRLRERVYVTKRQSTTEQAQPVTLRQEEAIVERLGDSPERAADRLVRADGDR